MQYYPYYSNSIHKPIQHNTKTGALPRYLLWVYVDVKEILNVHKERMCTFQNFKMVSLLSNKLPFILLGLF